jgi:hypothetical protein
MLVERRHADQELPLIDEGSGGPGVAGTFGEQAPAGGDDSLRQRERVFVAYPMGSSLSSGESVEVSCRARGDDSCYFHGTWR